MEAEEIDYFLLHQANDRMLDKMSKKLGVSREKIPANMMEYGNTSAASIPILLSECVENHRIKMDGSQKILLTGFGGGLTCGTLLVTIQLNMWKHILKIYILFFKEAYHGSI